MEITIKLKTGNAAFEDDRTAEVARILRTLVDKIEQGYGDGDAYDINGNNVGGFSIWDHESYKNDDDDETDND